MHKLISREYDLIGDTAVWFWMAQMPACDKEEYVFVFVRNVWRWIELHWLYTLVLSVLSSHDKSSTIKIFSIAEAKSER